ncbi:hypothetical protein Scep_005141 [Stephania cephalantha]|uniref:Uncharacterized protein n=1 Tax=Stephania cephalantha TaxID=152367 RepID=A0AAP0KVG6_9MAGN
MELSQAQAISVTDIVVLLKMKKEEAIGFRVLHKFEIFGSPLEELHQLTKDSLLVHLRQRHAIRYRYRVVLLALCMAWLRGFRLRSRFRK